MKTFRRTLLVAWIACVGAAWGAPTKIEPHVGFVYPAGGQQGTVVQVLVGGQFLRGASEVYVSGGGVTATVVRSSRALNNMNRQQLRDIFVRMNELRGLPPPEPQGPGDRARSFFKNNSAAPKTSKSGKPAIDRSAVDKPAANKPASAKPKKASNQNTKKPGAAKSAPPSNPNPKKPGAAKPKSVAAQPASSPANAQKNASAKSANPLALDVNSMTLRELEYVAAEFANFERRQPNPQIAETVLLEIAIAAGAAPGDRELRLATPAGLTNPLRFQVGQLPEICERESFGRQLLEPLTVDLPVTLNGQILPGDADRFRLRARRGQNLVIRAQARQLMPYLADAVPGWFQATLALYDAKDAELAFVDDYQFDPDPVLFYQVPADGVYELEIHDAIYRGRQDFVYRIAVGEQPFITGVYPLGARAGVATVAWITGWNLPTEQLPLDTRPGPDGIRQTALRQGQWLSNEVTYAVDSLPECEENEPNDSVQSAQSVVLPQIVNGYVVRPGDVDVFRFDGRAGQEVVAEILARRLGSPLDSLLRLTDASGRVLAWNDDHEDKGSGLLTHHADSYLSARLKEDGPCYAQVADSQRHGGPVYGYRLRLGPPRPDFALRVTPSSINVAAGHVAPIHVYALRKDGFDGDIELAVKDASAGFAFSGARIPSGRDNVRMTLMAPAEPLNRPVPLQLVGRAQIGGETVSRPVVPAEDMMQAFAYRHLTPSEELLVAVSGKRFVPSITLADDRPVQIPSGGTARVRFNTSRFSNLRNVQFELNEPPKGLTLDKVDSGFGGMALVLKTDGTAMKAGFEDNLIVEAFTEMAARTKAGAAPKQPQRVSLGVLPAIPYQIVRQ